jgi:outer membrane protein TolC
VARKSREALQAHLEQARASLEGRVVSTADVLDVESRLSLADLVLRRAQDLVVLSEAQLRIIMRDSSDAQYEPSEAGAPAMPNRAFAALREQALQSRAELRALTTTNKSLRSQARARAAAEFPRLDAIGNVYYQNPNPRYVPQQERFDATWDVGVQLTWSPTDALSAAATRREADAQALQIEEQRRALVDAIEIEVLSAYQAREQALVAQETAHRGLTAAEEAFRVRSELFRLGRATSTELSDSQTELTRARLSVVNADVDLRVARAKLVHAVGED